MRRTLLGQWSHNILLVLAGALFVVILVLALR